MEGDKWWRGADRNEVILTIQNYIDQPFELYDPEDFLKLFSHLIDNEDEKVFLTMLDKACEIFYGLVFYDTAIQTLMEDYDYMFTDNALPSDIKNYCPSYAKRIVDFAQIMDLMGVTTAEDINCFLIGFRRFIPDLLNEKLRWHYFDTSETILSYGNRPKNAIDEVVKEIANDVNALIKNPPVEDNKSQVDILFERLK